MMSRSPTVMRQHAQQILRKITNDCTTKSLLIGTVTPDALFTLLDWDGANAHLDLDRLRTLKINDSEAKNYLICKTLQAALNEGWMKRSDMELFDGFPFEIRQPAGSNYISVEIVSNPEKNATKYTGEADPNLHERQGGNATSPCYTVFGGTGRAHSKHLGSADSRLTQPPLSRADIIQEIMELRARPAVEGDECVMDHTPAGKGWLR